MPSRACLLHPVAAASFEELEKISGGLIYSDIYRSPAESLIARRQKTGVQPPGYSAHNFGMAVDIALEETIHKFGWDYPGLVAFMESYGWYCHRRDLRSGASESWHFNYIGTNEAAKKYLRLANERAPRTWSQPIEQLIQDMYGNAFVLSIPQVQQLLRFIRMYNGAIDGVLGPLTQEAIKVFRRAWGLPLGSGIDAMLMRTLYIVSAPLNIIELEKEKPV
jgi:hypothetical protein